MQASHHPIESDYRRPFCFSIHNLAVCSENLTTFPFSFSPISFTQPQSMDSMCISARNNIATLPKNHVRPKSEIPDHNAHRGYGPLKVFKFNLVPVWEVCLRTVFWFLEQKNTKNMFGKECCFCCPCFPCSPNPIFWEQLQCVFPVVLQYLEEKESCSSLFSKGCSPCSCVSPFQLDVARSENVLALTL